MEQNVFSKYTGSDESFVMPDNVTVIEAGAFTGIKSLKHIDLRNVRRIGASAFQECTGLETVIMSNVEVIEKGAFEFCTSLSDLNIPDEVTKIGESAFCSCQIFFISANNCILSKMKDCAKWNINQLFKSLSDR